MAFLRVIARNNLSLVSRFNTRNLSELKKIVADKIPKEVEKIKNFRKTHGSVVVADITIDRMYEGMTDMEAIIYEPSVLDRDAGIYFRGYPVLECIERLPKAKDGSQPLPEGLFWFLLTGEFPKDEQVAALSSEWSERASIPAHVASMIRNFPNNVHPMSQLSIAVTVLSYESKFMREYSKGIKKNVYWKYVYEDVMDLIAKLPVIAAYIYCNLDKKKECSGIVDPKIDWSSNLAHMMGFEAPEFIDFLRLYMTLHSDHEGGNVSTHAVNLVGSTLSDPYLAFAAGINGLSGPMHGRSNEYAMKFILKIQQDLGNNIKDESLKKYLEEVVKGGNTIPGFGHKVLRTTDPRYIGLYNFAVNHFPDDPLFQLASQLFKIAPGVLLMSGNADIQWPRIDALTGVLFSHYGLKEIEYYGVLAGVSRALGSLAGLIWSRALGIPLERPKSFSTDYLMKLLNVS